MRRLPKTVAVESTYLCGAFVVAPPMGVPPESHEINAAEQAQMPADFERDIAAGVFAVAALRGRRSLPMRKGWPVSTRPPTSADRGIRSMWRWRRRSELRGFANSISGRR